MTLLNLIKQKILNVTYLSNVQVNDQTLNQKFPKMESWEFLSFTNLEISLKLNFSNALYVSSSPVKDVLTVQVID